MFKMKVTNGLGNTCSWNITDMTFHWNVLPNYEGQLLKAHFVLDTSYDAFTTLDEIQNFLWEGSDEILSPSTKITIIDKMGVESDNLIPINSSDLLTLPYYDGRWFFIEVRQNFIGDGKGDEIVDENGNYVK